MQCPAGAVLRPSPSPPPPETRGAQRWSVFSLECWPDTPSPDQTEGAHIHPPDSSQGEPCRDLDAQTLSGPGGGLGCWGRCTWGQGDLLETPGVEEHVNTECHDCMYVRMYEVYMCHLIVQANTICPGAESHK